MSNLESVRRIYEAFGRGDVPAILERLSESVEWEYGVNSTDVPWIQPRRGRADVMNFFAALGNVEFHLFQPTAILEQGNLVIGLIDLEATVKATGRRVVEEDEVHIWRFDDQGLVTKFRHRVDTYLHAAAYHGADPLQTEVPAEASGGEAKYIVKDAHKIVLNSK